MILTTANSTMSQMIISKWEATRLATKETQDPEEEDELLKKLLTEEIGELKSEKEIVGDTEECGGAVRRKTPSLKMRRVASWRQIVRPAQTH